MRFSVVVEREREREKGARSISMGRGKLQLKRIEDKNSRHVTFSKRKTGLIKKGKELSVLCDVDVAVFVFSSKGKIYQFCTPDSLRKMFESFQIPREADVACGSAPHSEKIPERQMNKGDGTNLLQAVQRYIEELKVEQLKMMEITQLEHGLGAISHQLRVKKEKLLKGGKQYTVQEIPDMASEDTNRADNSCYYPREEDNDPFPADDVEEFKTLPAIEDTTLFW